MSAPTISSVVWQNQMIDVTFSAACYNTNGGSGALEASDFTVTYTDNSDTGISSARIYAIKTTANAALSGGETTVRIWIEYEEGANHNPPSGLATIEVKPVADSVYNAGGEAMADTQTTGVLTVEPFKFLFLSKTGNDANDGLTYDQAKLTLAGVKAVCVTGENKVIIGVGTYTEVTNFDGSGKYVTLYGDYNGLIYGSSAGTITRASSDHIADASGRKFERITYEMTGSSKRFIGNLPASAVYYNYITFKCSGSSPILMYSVALSAAYSITFNNCILIADAKTLALGSSSVFTIYPFLCNVIFNDCDFSTYVSTSGYGLTPSFGKAGNMTFNNCLLRFNESYITYYHFGSIKFIGCTLRSPGSVGMYLMTTSTTATQPSSNMDTLMYFEDCNFYDNSGNLEQLSEVSIMDTSGQQTAYNRINNYSKISNWWGSFGNLRAISNNTSSDGLLKFFKPELMYYDLAAQYDSKDTYQIKQTASAVFMIPIEGDLANSESYDITFDYKQKFTLQSGDYFVFAIVEGDTIQRDVYNEIIAETTPTVTEDYEKIVYGGGESVDTWYTKTLTLTTPSDMTAKQYFLVMYAISFTNNMEITLPRISLTA